MATRPPGSDAGGASTTSGAPRLVRLATFNVNSIRARLPRVLAWLERARPDVVCLQETKVEDGAFPLAEVTALGYSAALHGQRTYNGVAILARGAPLVDVERGFGDGEADAQARFIAARVGALRVACAYVPNGQAPGTEKFAYKLEWYRRLRAWLDRRARGDTGDDLFVLCGDFNVAPEDLDVSKVEEWRDKIHCSPPERAALADVVASGLQDLFRRHHPEGGHYTWWDYRQLAFPKNNGLRIDHVLATPALAARCEGAVIERDERKGKEPSDHVPVIVTLAV